MKRPITQVSDHALLRYLERIHGLDVEGLRQSIGHTVDRAAAAGATGVVIDGYCYKIVQQERPVVVTVRRTGAPNIRAGHKRRGSP